MGIDKYNEECRGIVQRYTGEWRMIVERLCHTESPLAWKESSLHYSLSVYSGLRRCSHTQRTALCGIDHLIPCPICSGGRHSPWCERETMIICVISSRMGLNVTAVWALLACRFGRWIDFDNDYKTMDLSFMESVW
eukprot:1695815-Amphidinium_carterae.1